MRVVCNFVVIGVKRRGGDDYAHLYEILVVVLVCGYYNGGGGVIGRPGSVQVNGFFPTFRNSTAGGSLSHSLAK